MYNKEATIETARQGAAPPRGGGEEEGEGEGGAGIDPVSMGAVRAPRRHGSARRSLRPGRYGRHEIQDLGHLGGPEKEDFGVLDGAEAEPKRREAGALGAGRGGGNDRVDGSKELRCGVN